MRQRVILVVLLLMCVASLSAAQDVPAPAIVPAERLLQLRAELSLDDAQAEKLGALAKVQAAAIAKVAAAYLRAEADLIDAARNEDLAVRRVALERRAKAAIDAEMIRLRAEKDARALLTPKQAGLLPSTLSSYGTEMTPVRTSAIWGSLVAPQSLIVPVAESDSVETRIVVSPLTAQIYIGDRLVGSGRSLVRLPVGQHILKFRTPACLEQMVIVVAKGPQSPVTHTMACSR
jgi:Spy/CpxP family protein refolding chaperone